jgi:hypothetical protein
MQEKETDNLKTKQGIALFKIDYWMDVKGGNVESNTYSVGIIAYTSDEAVKTLNNFCLKNITGFKGMRIDQVAFEGLCHAISDKVRDKIIEGAVRSKIVEYVKYVKAESEEEKKKTYSKKSIIPKNIDD